MFGEIDRNEDPLIDEVTFFRRGLITLLGRGGWLERLSWGECLAS
jgi:hypothetical protein